MEKTEIEKMQEILRRVPCSKVVGNGAEMWNRIAVIKAIELALQSASSPSVEKEPKEWISVEERHPAYLEPVLTIDKNNNVRILQREDWESGNDVEGYKSGEFWTDPETAEEYEIELITYWMPIPNLPKI